MISAGSACKERLFAKLMNFLKFRKSFKKLFEPTQKGSLTVHLRAKSRPFWIALCPRWRPVFSGARAPVGSGSGFVGANAAPQTKPAEIQ